MDASGDGGLPGVVEGMGGRAQSVAATLDTVRCADGSFLRPQASRETVWRNPEMLVVPDGQSEGALECRLTLELATAIGFEADLMVAIGQGVRLAGRAGLLHGYKVAAVRDARAAIRRMGAHVVAGRVVEDRNRITSTSACDLLLARRVRSRLNGEQAWPPPDRQRLVSPAWVAYARAELL
ncbi:MAG: DJ-1/PfpI family protein [Brevundimonas sp.]